MSDLGSTFRRSLWPLSWLYGFGVFARNAMFERGWRQVHKLSVPVISVGNLSAGGTGKTPLVVWLVERMRAAGLRPGVLARGYGRAVGQALNDEGQLLQVRFPDLPQVQDPDRVAGGRRLVAEHGVDHVVLDDGFQHRRLHRDRDIVCLDATNPFAFGMLPSGNLREPRSALRRADAIVLTRAHGCSAADVDARRERILQISGKEIPVLASEHAPRDIVSRPTGAVEEPASLAGVRVLAMSGVARPDSFAETLTRLGAVVAREIRHGDHHRFARSDLDAAAFVAEQEGARLVVTEKDDVKLASLDGDNPVRRSVLRIDLRFLFAEPGLEPFGL